MLPAGGVIREEEEKNILVKYIVSLSSLDIKFWAATDLPVALLFLRHFRI